MTPLQGERRWKELGHEKEEKEASEHEEKPEVCCDLRSFQRVVILTLPQKEKERKDLEHEKEEEARKRREELKVLCDSCLF